MQLAVLEAQLTNLFQINNVIENIFNQNIFKIFSSQANDAVLDCITSLEGLPLAANPQPNPALQSQAGCFTLIGRGLLRLCSDWLDHHDVTYASSLMP